MRIYGKAKRYQDTILTVLILLSAGISLCPVLGIIGYVFVKGFPVISPSFLMGVTSVYRGTVGIAGNILNTLYLTALTLLIATPIGVGSAIYLNEYAGDGKFVKMISFTTKTLAGIPSILFGLFGKVFFGDTLKLGYCILTGALTLSLMILPLITENTMEALKAVPQSYRSGALGMGAGKWYMIRTVLLPSAVPGILAGVLLGMGRIMGESAALLFTAGSAAALPKSFLGHIMAPGGSLTIQMYLSMTKAEYSVAFGIAFVLLVLVLLLNIPIKLLGRRK